ncbi:MAG: glycoside hydrolase family 13 protein [Chloroflexia bacterium]
MSNETTSQAASRHLRNGNMPHVPPPATPISTWVHLELDAPEGSHPEAIFKDIRRDDTWRVALSIQSEDESQFKTRPVKLHNSKLKIAKWFADILLPQEPTLLRYHFVLRDGSILQENRQMEGTDEPLYGVWEEHDFQIAVYDPTSIPPDWVAGAVVYQIFPDRFARANPKKFVRGGGAYGRETIYNDWYAKPEHPPKGRDFYGGDLRGVIEKLDYLEELGINLIYFTPIFASPTNHRYDALDYTQIDPTLGTEADLKELIEVAGARGIRVLLDGVFNHCSRDSIYFKAAQSSKESPYYRWFNFIKWPETWVGWMGVKTMPELVECPEVEEFFFGKNGIARHWLSYGTAGWRTDVTPWITDEWWRRFRRAIRKAYPDAYLVAEDWTNSSRRLVGDTFDATMNYRFAYSVLGFAGQKLTPSELDDRLETLRRDTPFPSFMAQMNLLGSHDTERILSILGSKERVKLAAALQLAYPGAPMVYYGDEAGIGDIIPVEGKRHAEDSRSGYPWGQENKDLLDFYKQAINTRRSSQALTYGEVSTVWIDDRGGYGIMRHHGEDIVIALFNSSPEPLEASIPIGESAPSGDWPDLLGRLPAIHAEGGTLQATVQAGSAGWFQAPLPD